MMYGKRVKQDDRRAIPQNRVRDLGISATNAIHAQILNAGPTLNAIPLLSARDY
jgi:hypothetical protein